MSTVTYLKDRKSFLKSRREDLELKVDQVKGWLGIASEDVIQAHRSMHNDIAASGFVSPSTIELLTLSQNEAIDASEALNNLLEQLMGIHNT